MTSDRDIERVLDHWFTERPTQVADRSSTRLPTGSGISPSSARGASSEGTPT